ncbi:hypothetical protein ACOMHN_062524 [Nucella lapillus]
MQASDTQFKNQIPKHYPADHQPFSQNWIHVHMPVISAARSPVEQTDKTGGGGMGQSQDQGSADDGLSGLGGVALTVLL